MTTLPFSSTTARAARLIVVALALMLIVAAFAATTAHAAGTVTDCSTYGPGAGTLQDALTGGGTVTFACDGTIIVPEITISQDTLVDATGHDVTLSGNNANRVFNVASGSNLALESITIANAQSTGNGGGVVVNPGTQLTVRNSIFRDNRAEDFFANGGAIVNRQGTLLVENSEFVGNRVRPGSGRGGAIAQLRVDADAGSTTIAGSTFRDNRADDGGALAIMVGAASISNSTFRGNATGTGGDGGAILAFGESHSIDSVTITENTAGRGGGIHVCSSCPAELKNTIVYGNSASTGPDISGPVTSNDHNLIGTTAGATITPQANDIIGQNPLLGPLASNGGPTQTMALLPGSPAINAGDTALTTDQRGITRPSVSVDDIGAFESRGFSLAYSAGNNQSTLVSTAFSNPLVVTVSSSFSEPVDGGQVTFTAPGSGASLSTTPLSAAISNGSASQAVSANGTAGSYTVSADTRGNLGSSVSFNLRNLAVDCSASSWNVGNEVELNEAIACYNAKTTAGVYTINLTQDIDLTASTTIIDNHTAGVDLVIAGGGFTVDGQGTSGVKPFNVQGARVTMNNLTVKGGNSTAGAGGIYNFGNLTLNNCTVTSNSAATVGGGIRNDGTLTLNNSTVSGNTAGTGGGIYVGFGSASLDSVTVADNSAATGGGVAQITAPPPVAVSPRRAVR